MLQIWKIQQWPQDWKRSVFISIPKKGNAKECSNYCTIAFISHASKIMFKILQARLPQYMNCELPDVQARFRIGRGARGQVANIHWIIEKITRIPEKTSTSALLTTSKPLCGSEQTVFPGGSVSKDFSCFLRDVSLYPRSGKSPSKEMVTHSSIIA